MEGKTNKIGRETPGVPRKNAGEQSSARAVTGVGMQGSRAAARGRREHATAPFKRSGQTGSELGAGDRSTAIARAPQKHTPNPTPRAHTRDAAGQANGRNTAPRPRLTAPHKATLARISNPRAAPTPAEQPHHQARPAGNPGPAHRPEHQRGPRTHREQPMQSASAAPLTRGGRRPAWSGRGGRKCGEPAAAACSRRGEGSPQATARGTTRTDSHGRAGAAPPKQAGGTSGQPGRDGERHGSRTAGGRQTEDRAAQRSGEHLGRAGQHPQPPGQPRRLVPAGPHPSPRTPSRRRPHRAGRAGQPGKPRTPPRLGARSHSKANPQPEHPSEERTGGRAPRTEPHWRQWAAS